MDWRGGMLIEYFESIRQSISQAVHLSWLRGSGLVATAVE